MGGEGQGRKDGGGDKNVKSGDVGYSKIRERANRQKVGGRSLLTEPISE